MSWFSVLLYLTGFLCAVVALWRSRTPQGAAAWVVALVTSPLVALPLFFVFGRNKFLKYVRSRREMDSEAQQEMKEVDRLLAEIVPGPLPELDALAKAAVQPGFTGHNTIDLLDDGEAVYARILDELERAEKYILFQFYIFRPDATGERFIRALERKARAGVRVFFLFDRVGTSLPGALRRRLTDAGVEVGRFESSKGWPTRFQINFRNHRKIVVVDGRIAFTGGFNVGDDYVGKYPVIGPWRDTHVRIEGPAALEAQLSFVKDWNWVKDRVLDLDWRPRRSAGDARVWVMHTGPADEEEPCLLAHIALVNSARRRVWIANPYFLPPEGLANALALARLRGVEVRALVPSFTDNWMVEYAADAAIEKMLAAGVRFYRYLPGFLHQKVLLIDDAIATVGSVNLDPRSIFINFEVTAVSPDAAFVARVARMLEKDFGMTRETTLDDYARRPFWRQLRARAFSLLSPML